MILKIIGSIFIITSSSAIGVYFSNRIKERVEDLKLLKRDMFILKGDIRYAKATLPESLDGIAERNKGKFYLFFRTVADQLLSGEGYSFQEIWSDAVKEHLNTTCMSEKDKMYFASLGENLGYLDKEMQINTIDLYLARLDEEIESASKAVLEKAKLYNILGIIGGIFITIIML